MGSSYKANRHKGPRELVSGGEWLYGRNPVEEALAAGRRTFSEVILPPAAPNEDDQIRRIRDEAHARRLVVRTMDRDALDRLTRFGHHQGCALKSTGYPYVGFSDILSSGMTTPVAPTAHAVRRIDPTFCGSSRWSRTTTRAFSSSSAAERMSAKPTYG